MGRTSKVLGILSIIGTAWLFSCIDRDNPFDPVNLSTIQPAQIREQNRSFFDTLQLRSNNLANSIVAGIKILSAADSSGLSKVEKANDSILLKNANTRASNLAIQSANEIEVDPARLKDKSFLETLKIFPYTTAYKDLGRNRDELNLIRSQVLVHMDSLNQAFFPQKIYSDELRRSESERVDSLIRIVENLISDSAQWDERMQKHRVQTNLENQSIETENLSISRYNDDINWRRSRGNRPIIVSSDSLLNKVSNLALGDSLFLDSGTYSGRFIIPISGTPNQPILIQGRIGGRTVISSTDSLECLFLDGIKNVVFRDLVFANIGNSGARVTNNSDSVQFERCEFRNNSKDGLTIVSSGVQAYDCSFIGNKGNGVSFNSLGNNNLKLDLVNVLIAHNGGHGIAGEDIKGTVTHATISDNGQDGIHFSGSIGDLSIYSSIIVFQKGFGLNYSATSPPGNQLVLLNCDLFGNGLENFSQPLPVSPLNITVNLDPRFISRDPTIGLNYSLGQDSDLLKYEEGGIVIGWRKP